MGKGWQIIFFILAGFSACRPSVPAQEGRKVEEIAFSGDFRNSELIRNPTSLRGQLSPDSAPAITFQDTVFDFGEVREGEVVEYAFVFKNTGKGPLLIARARSTCGCTVPEWPENPIPPGGTGKITARFDTEGKVGVQLKPITISANTPEGNSKVYLSGKVLSATTQ